MSTKFKIKRTSDIDLVRRLHKKLFPGDRFYIEGTAFWVVENAKGKVVGFCIFGEWSEGIGFLARAGLLEKARGQGLHRRMITVRERHARKAGYPKMATYTAIDSVDSSLNLKRTGYKLYQPAEALPGTWLYWMKSLLPKQKPATPEVPNDGAI